MLGQFFLIRPTHVNETVLVGVEEVLEEVGQLLQLEGGQLPLQGGIVHTPRI